MANGTTEFVCVKGLHEFDWPRSLLKSMICSI